MKTPNFSKLKHWLVNAPMHFYTETKDDGTEVLRHIRVQQKNFEVPADGVTIDVVPPDSVGTDQIENGSVQAEDLSEGVKNAMITDKDRVTQEQIDNFEV